MKKKALIIKSLIAITAFAGIYLAIKTIKTKEEKSIIEISGNNEFIIDAEKDYILEVGNDLVVSIPKGAFIDKNGNPIEGEIRFVINSGIDIEEKIEKGLFDTYEGKLLATYKDLAIEATQNGKELDYNSKVPIVVDVITGQIGKLNLFKSNNNNWELKETVKYLEKYPIKDLDFLPEGFEEAAKQVIPFGKYKKATKKEIENLYYSLECPLPYTIAAIGSVPDSLTEKEAINWGIIKRDTLYYLDFAKYETTPQDTIGGKRIKRDYIGVNPRSVKILKTRKFKDTYIATKEFEERLKWVIKSCEQEILQFYINNLDSNMYKADELSMKLLKERNHPHEIIKKFEEFASLKLTNVKDNTPSKRLIEYYSKKLIDLDKKLEKELDKVRKKQSKKDKKAKDIFKKYNKLLSKRLKYRLKKFGFTPTSNGIYKLARIIESLEPFELNVRITNGAEYDRAHVYTIDERIKSIFALNSVNKVDFNYAYSQDPLLLLKKGQMIKVIGIGYKGEKPAYHLIDCQQQKIMNIDLNLQDCKARELSKVLKKISKGYQRENEIFVDLNFQKKIFEELKRKEIQYKENEIINYLKEFAFPCLKKLNRQQNY